MKIRVPESVVTIDMPEGQAVFDRNTKALVRLDARSTVLWKALSAARSIEGAAAAIAKDSDQTRTAIVRELRKFVAHLATELGMIELQAGFPSRYFFQEHGLRKTVTEIRCAWSDARFDWRHGTDTGGTVGLAKLSEAAVRHAFYYIATPVRVFRHAIRCGVPVQKGYTFIDFGSGKGRVLLMASQYAFERVIGVELSKDLHAIAQRNIAIYRNAAQRCPDIVSICYDAAEFDLPDDDLVLYFWTPFRLPVLERVLARVEASFEKHDRRLIVIVYAARNDFIEPFRQSRLVAEHAEIPIPRASVGYEGARLLLFSNKALTA